MVWKMLELWGSCGRRVEVRVGSRIEQGLVWHVCVTVLGRLWGGRSWMLHWNQVGTGPPTSLARRWS